MNKNFKIFISIFISFIFISQSIYAQKTKSKKEEIEFLNANLLDSSKQLKVLREEKSALESIKKNLEAEIQKSNSKKNKNVEPLADLEYRNIGTLKWASKNLDVKQVESLIGKIEKSQDLDTWNKYVH